MEHQPLLETSVPKLCHDCNRKLNILSFACKCKNFYCKKHQHFLEHNCTYNYRKSSENLLRKNNPVVNGSKLNKI